MNGSIFEMHAEICKVFTSPKRLEIINALRDGERSVGELVDLLGIRQTNLSQHLSILREKGVVSMRKEGQNVYYSVANPKILDACDLMREVLLERLAANDKLRRQFEKKTQ